MDDLTELGTPAVSAAMNYKIYLGVGRARYVVNFHDGVRTHPDGSAFYDMRIFSNKRALHTFTAELRRAGYEGVPS